MGVCLIITPKQAYRSYNVKEMSTISRFEISETTCYQTSGETKIFMSDTDILYEIENE